MKHTQRGVVVGVHTGDIGAVDTKPYHASELHCHGHRAALNGWSSLDSVLLEEGPGEAGARILGASSLGQRRWDGYDGGGANLVGEGRVWAALLVWEASR